ncbi:hypothetical protein [Oceaniglobus trochenteri]|uniref:hypothetical protein n=1 Tax=Oceaniglobus trochenteri TaxID=2763260 RepID=UPI001CFF85E3|nr:hypothetical protein [Oceaniglobus trochenteri]
MTTTNDDWKGEAAIRGMKPAERKAWAFVTVRRGRGDDTPETAPEATTGQHRGDAGHD